MNGMKRIYAFVQLLLAVLIFGSAVGCSAEEEDNLYAGALVANPPLPHQADTLRILAIGNSFTDDALFRLPFLLRDAGIHRVILGRLTYGGCDLKQHADFATDDRPAYAYHRYNPHSKA